MLPNRLFALYRANANRGEFRAESNTLYVYDVIVSSKADAEWLGGVDAETFVQALGAMTGEVTVRLNSPGGDVFAGVAMATAVRNYPGKVNVFVDGYAASAASVLAAAGDTVTMAPGSMQMIHNAWTIAVGDRHDFQGTSGLLEKIDGSLAESYATTAKKRKVDMSAATFAEMMDAETWLTPQEAIDAGLADAVAESGAKATAAWDLSVYAKAPAKIEAEAEPVDDGGDANEPEPAPEVAPDSDDELLQAQARARTAAVALLFNN